MNEYVTIHIPRNAIPISSRRNSEVLVSVSGEKRMVSYGESAQFRINDQAVAHIFMGKNVKQLREYVYPGKTYAVRFVEMVFSQVVIELVEI